MIDNNVVNNKTNNFSLELLSPKQLKLLQGSLISMMLAIRDSTKKYDSIELKVSLAGLVTDLLSKLDDRTKVVVKDGDSIDDMDMIQIKETLLEIDLPKTIEYDKDKYLSYLDIYNTYEKLFDTIKDIETDDKNMEESLVKIIDEFENVKNDLKIFDLNNYPNINKLINS